MNMQQDVHRKRNIIVADLGGSFLRMACLEPHGPGEIIVIKISQYKSFDEALNYFCAQTGIILKDAGMFLSFGRKQQPNEIHTLGHKKNDWSFVPDDIKNKYQMAFFQVVHDARAMALATLSERGNVFLRVAEYGEQGVQACSGGRKLIILAGTGVGHAYIDTGACNVTDCHITDCHGAHFSPSFSSVEQAEILLRVYDYLNSTGRLSLNQKEPRTFVFEDMLSGDGLHSIYAAICHKQFPERPVGGQWSNTKEMLAHCDDDIVRKAADYYSAFLGLYAQTLAVSGHAYDGVYICGGHIERRDRCGLLNWEIFYRNFMQNMVRVVHDDLAKVGIHKVAAEHTALFGLEVEARNIQ